MRRFWRGIAIFLLGGVLGTAFGIALGFFFFPYVFPPPPAFEQLTQADVAPRSGAAPSTAVVEKPPAPVASGTFIHANPSDPVHWGRGKVSVYERTVFLEPDFEVGPGPKRTSLSDMLPPAWPASACSSTPLARSASAMRTTATTSCDA